MSKRTELDRLFRDMAKAVLAELTPPQQAFFEQDPRAPYDLDIWIGKETSRSIARIAKKAQTYHRRFAK